MAASSSGGGDPPPQPAAGHAPPPSSSPFGENDQDPLRTQLPIETLVYSAYRSVLFLLANYGWHILLLLIVLAIVWTNIKPSVLRWLRKRQERLEEENFDPDKAERFQDGMIKAREKMQKDLEEKARLYQEEEEEKAAKARDERIKQWEEFKVVTKPRTKLKGSSNPREYFPLGGGAGGGGYRPQRRTLGGGGGG